MSRSPLQRRRSSYHYQTFPTTPPATRGRPLSSSRGSSGRSGGVGSGSSSLSGQDADDKPDQTPIPYRQLAVLAVISLAEQTALNSISPYLPEMAATFPEVDAQKVGLYVGIIASSFAGAQFATNIFWGRLSDRVGRKPVILLGTLLTCICFLAFGFCKTLAQAVVVQVLMGIVNANAVVVSTVLGEITDKSNQSFAFSYLPIIYGIGGITGPMVGGLLVNPSPHPTGPVSRLFAKYPYLLPNLVAAVLLMADLVMSVLWLDESLHEAQHLPPLGARVRCVFSWFWQFSAYYIPSYVRNIGRNNDEEQEIDDSSHPPLAEACHVFPGGNNKVPYKEILIPQIIILMITYAMFSFNNVAFNSLYPIYASTPRPTGRGLGPKEIGLSLSFAGAVAIVFQAFLFTPIQSRLGNVWCYRLGFLGFVVTFFAMPFVGLHDPSDSSGRLRIWAELGSTLLLKTVASVGGLTCAMMLITNASPKPQTLGTLNGLAQTLCAGGRAIGPFVSGGLFTASTKFKSFGEMLAWGVFGGIAAMGMGMTWALRSSKLESGETDTLLGDDDLGEGA